MNNSNILDKLYFLIKRPTLIIIIGEKTEKVFNDIKNILKVNLKNKDNFVVFATENKNMDNFNFFIKHSRKTILVLSEINFLQKNIEKSINNCPKKSIIIINNDNYFKKKIRKITDLSILSFGFSKKNDIIAINSDTSLKIGYKGNIIPTWFKGRFRKDIYSILSTFTVGVALELDLVEISKIFKKDNF